MGDWILLMLVLLMEESVDDIITEQTIMRWDLIGGG
jgi:hypothetical protein